MFRQDFDRLEELLLRDEEIVLQRCYHNSCFGGGYIYKVKLRSSDLFFVDVFTMDLFYSDCCDLESMWEKTRVLSMQYYLALKDLFNENHTEFRREYFPEAKPEIDDAIRTLEKQYLAQFEAELNTGGKYCYLTRGVEQDIWFRSNKKILRADDWLPFLVDSIVFEGEKYCTFRNYDQWLKNAYGEYMCLPRSIGQSHANELSNPSPKDLETVKRIKELYSCP